MKSSLTIAVLPFLNFSSSEENEYFCDGMTEEIINALAGIQGLQVTSRTSSFYFKDKQLPLPEIAESLGVSVVLEGSIRLSGSQMRITAQLIQAEEDYHFWSDTFDRSMDDLFAVQDEISLLIADRLREQIGHFEYGNRLVEAPDVPVHVYQTYLKGRFHLMKLNLPETEKAISLFKKVIEEVPNFALPYLDINQGYTFLGTMGLLPAMEAFSLAQPFIQKALAINPDLPQSQLNLAWISCWQNRDLESAFKHAYQALETRPSDDIYLTISNLLTIEGKFEVAHNCIDKALELDPFSGMNHHYKGFLLYLEEKYAMALPHFEKSLELNPNLPFPHLYMGNSLWLQGKPNEALAFFQSLSHPVPGDLTALGGSTLAHASAGDLENAEVGMVELENRLDSSAGGSALVFLIQCHVVLGDLEEALRLMEKAVEIQLPTILLFPTEPILKPLRTQARFKELTEQVLGPPSSFGQPRKKYRKPLFSRDELTSARRRLEKHMSKEQPHLNPNLNLRDLAGSIGFPPNHLSQLLNEGFQRNFSEFVNQYRLEFFKAKVADPQSRHQTILALALDSGFNSKTVFNTYFKKTTGMTPKAYWKATQEQNKH